MPSNAIDRVRATVIARNLSRALSVCVSSTFRTRFLGAKCVGR